MAQDTTPATGRPAAEVLADAVKVLTEAARLTRPVLVRDAATGTPEGAVWVDSGGTERADWAEFVTLALAGAAANVGGIETALAGRAGSWEADGVRALLTGTVGADEEMLLSHRTEPLAITVYVDELMADGGLWATYDAAAREVHRRLEATGATHTEGETVTDPTPEQQDQADALFELEERLEALREQDWRAYGADLAAHIETAAAQVPGLDVPVLVTVDTDTFRGPDDVDAIDPDPIATRLILGAVTATPLPGGGRAPLDRLERPDEASADQP